MIIDDDVIDGDANDDDRDDGDTAGDDGSSGDDDQDVWCKYQRAGCLEASPNLWPQAAFDASHNLYFQCTHQCIFSVGKLHF